MDKPKNNNTEWIEKYAVLLDSQFRIPFTNIRFGIDPILSLVPVLGTFSGLILGIVLIVLSSQNNVSYQAKAKMIRNVTLDFLFGLIPIVGNVKDVVYKSNEKNMKIILENVNEGKHNGPVHEVLTSTVKLIVIALIILALLLILLGVYIIYLIF